ncbi:GTPase domain-containing protein [Nocardiopsis synnemataformans]|uniref:GTPase domain-containing protein n=1 Tax=Nocardiopsis synnemataformans TaxID=61305 RepID=UPI003EBD0ED0
MNSLLQAPEVPRQSVQIRCPQVQVMVHSIVARMPRSTPPGPGSAELVRRVYDACAQIGRPLSVGELAEQLACPPAVVGVAVSDLIHQHRLCLYTGSHQRRTGPGRYVLERLRDRLRERAPYSADTVKFVVVGEDDRDVTTFLTHISGEHPFPVSSQEGRTEVEGVVSRIDADLYLAVLGVHQVQVLREQWPDLMREADGALLLTRSDELARSRSAARLLANQASVPYITVVHLADEDDLDSPRVHEELQLEEMVPVVMVDIHSPASATTALADLCTWALDEGERR